MTPLQEIDVGAGKHVFFRMHLVAPAGVAPFIAEVHVYDSAFSPSFQASVSFRQHFGSASEAFEHAIKWVSSYCAKHGYTIDKINNPCNCEFLARDDQQLIVNRAGHTLQVLENGS